MIPDFEFMNKFLPFYFCLSQNILVELFWTHKRFEWQDKLISSLGQEMAS